MKSPSAPAWTERESDSRSAAKATKVIVLYELHRSGKLSDVATKKELAAMFKVSRWTLDRYLATLRQAIEQAESLLKKF